MLVGIKQTLKHKLQKYNDIHVNSGASTEMYAHKYHSTDKG